MSKAFYILIFLFCAAESYNAHLIDAVYEYVKIAWSNLIMFQLAVVAMAGRISNGSRKHKTVLSAVCGFVIFQLITDWSPVFPAWLASWETELFFGLVVWLTLRPERLPSYLGPNVSLAFYSGSEAPIIGHVLSLLSLPYTGVALVVDGQMMMPRRKVGKFVKISLDDVSRRWTVLGTPSKTTPEIKAIFNGLEGAPVTMANCISAIRPALVILGYRSQLPGPLAMEVLNGR